MPPSKAGQQGSYIESPYNIIVGYGNPRAGIVQNTGADWFGPLDPIRPIAPSEIAGRQWDFPAGYNLQTKPRVYEPITFQTLRDLADSYDILRIIIETRKDELSRMNWRIRYKDGETQSKGDSRIKEIERFFNKPDGYRYWPEWIRFLLEDMFVIDAATLYVRRTRAGKLFELHPLDGATIKPVIDDWGRKPQPQMENGKPVYPVAYQQILKGYPAVDYTERDLIYKPRNVRTNKAYGMSPVEQIITTVNIALRKQLFTLNYYTEGNIPDSLIGTPETWSALEIKEYQRYWDEFMEGDLARRRRAKFVPGGLSYQATKEPDLKNDFDEWLARVVCYCFSVSPQPFVKQQNRGTAETQREIAEEQGLRPIRKWVKGFVDEIIENEFDAEDLEFGWETDEDPDEERQAQILEGYVSKGIITINEARAELGRDPLDNEAADQPMIVTTTGWVPIEANTIEGKKAMTSALGLEADGSLPEPDNKQQPKPKAKAEKLQLEMAL